jgi:hypothetical protein
MNLGFGPNVDVRALTSEADDEPCNEGLVKYDDGAVHGGSRC